VEDHRGGRINKGDRSLAPLPAGHRCESTAHEIWDIPDSWRKRIDSFLGGGTGFRPTANGGGTFLFDAENRFNERNSSRYIGNVSSSYFPAEWVTLDAQFAYDNRSRIDEFYLKKGYRTTTASSSMNGQCPTIIW
jgi:hypothetical protein